MPHLRKRHLSPRLATALKHSPIVGLFGHRQVGKTTTLEGVSKNYLTFDSKHTRLEASEDPETFLAKSLMTSTPVAIDECQLVPEVFPALKESVRKNKAPGSFLLSGSVRFTSRKVIQESLTGRILSLELLPLTLSEISGAPLSDFLIWASTLAEITESRARSRIGDRRTQSRRWRDIESYLARGGLPGICFMREPQARKDAIASLLRTIIERDLPLVKRSLLSPTVLLELARLIAKNGWSPLNMQAIKSETGVAHETQKKILYAMESVFLLRTIMLEGDFKGPIHVFEDQLEQRFLRQAPGPEDEEAAGLLFRNLRAQYLYRTGMDFTPFVYRTRGGAEVPLAFRSETGVVGFIPFLGSEPTLSNQRSATSFLRRYDRSKVVFVSTHPHEPVCLDSRTMIADLATVLY